MENSSFLIHPEELSYKWIDRMASHGIKTLALHPAGGYKAPVTLARMLELLEDDGYRRMLDYAHKKGLRIEYEMHAARYLLPKELFSEHPEYFRMAENGERRADVNFCASNEDALAIFCENAAALARKLYRSGPRYFFWLDDSEDSACHCPKCREFSASDQQLIILNAMLKRIRRDRPDASVPYLAYLSCITPPQKIKAEKGIFLEFAPIKRDHARPLSESGQRENIVLLIEFFGADTAKALDYWYDNSLFSDWKKPPARFCVNENALESDISFYRSLGFNDIGTFACFLGEDYEALYGEPDISAFKRAVNKRNL